MSAGEILEVSGIRILTGIGSYVLSSLILYLPIFGILMKMEAWSFRISFLVPRFEIWIHTGYLGLIGLTEKPIM